MKTDKDKEKQEKLQEVEVKLNERVEGFMGPAPENANTVVEQPKNKEKKHKKTPEPEVIEPTGPPVVDAKAKTDTSVPSDEEFSSQTVEQAEKIAKEQAEEAPDPELEKVVDDIVEKESDDALKNDDEAVEKAFTADKPGKRKNIFSRWLHSRKARRITLLILVLAIAAVAVVPTSRYLVLNTAGVRSNASLSVLDESTQQPLKNVKVSAAGVTATTDEQGKVTLSGLKLGSTTLVVERRAFATLSRPMVVGWGSNPLGQVSVSPRGLQYAIVVKDFLSGKPIEKAEAISGDASAFSDKDGKILLTLDTKTDDKVEITVKADTYRDEKIVDTGKDQKLAPVKMVPSQKQTFISKRSGKYDIYKIDADGKNEALVLSGTGYERDDMAVVPQTLGSKVAVVSTRDNMRSTNGDLLNTISVLDIDSGKVKSLETAERVQVVGWDGNDLVFVSIGSTTATQAKKQRLVTYSAKTDTKADITSANYFNDILFADGKVYYAPAADAVVDPAAPAASSKPATIVGFFRVDADAGNPQKLLDKEIWNAIRTSYDTLALSAGKDWYSYKIGASKTETLGGAPVDQTSRMYVNSPNGKHSLWVDKRDGKGVLVAYDTAKKEDKVLVTQSGLAQPVRWLNDSTAIFRIHTDQETADYVVNLDGGTPKKVVDVTNTTGIDNWYYY